jgi:hypothetical protein
MYNIDVICAFNGCAVNYDLCNGFDPWSVIDDSEPRCILLVSATLAFMKQPLIATFSYESTYWHCYVPFMVVV